MAKRTMAVGVEVDGKVEWHAPPVGPTDYHTMCGLDANDPVIGHNGEVEAAPGQKITCSICRGIWRDVIALKLRESDFAV